MKKLIAIACVMAMVGVAVQSQAATKYSIGVKGGVNLADVSQADSSGNDVGDTSMRNGFMGGAFLSMKYGERWGSRIEALYVQKGAKFGEGSSETTYKADYIEFPLLAVATFPAGEKFGVDLFLGPTLGFNIKGEAESGGQTEDIKDSIESFEFGLAFGAGAEYALSSMSIVFDVRYSFGLTNALKDAVGDESVKNRGTGIMAGIAFPIGAQQ